MKVISGGQDGTVRVFDLTTLKAEVVMPVNEIAGLDRGLRCPINTVEASHSLLLSLSHTQTFAFILPQFVSPMTVRLIATV